jgi:hypothetical protein
MGVERSLVDMFYELKRRREGNILNFLNFLNILNVINVLNILNSKTLERVKHQTLILKKFGL